MDMERFTGKANKEDQGTLALILDLAKALRRVQFEGCVAEPLQTITPILPGSKWSCLLLRIVLQDALSEVTKIYPPLKLRVFVDDITALLKVKNREVAKNGKEGDEEAERS